MSHYDRYCHTISQQGNCVKCQRVDLEVAWKKEKELQTRLAWAEQMLERAKNAVNHVEDFEVWCSDLEKGPQ